MKLHILIVVVTLVAGQSATTGTTKPNLTAAPPTQAPPTTQSDASFIRDVILGIVVGVGAPIVINVLYLCVRLRQPKPGGEEEESAPQRPLPKSELTPEPTPRP